MEPLRNIPISKLHESLTNPRRNFKNVEDLAQSIREKGILVPLLVREDDGGYEIIAGACRYRGALKAGISEVPAIIKNITDEEVLEIQIVENIHRNELHPMEEALGYKTMIVRASYDAPAIALKVGKCETYVYQRLKLLDLIQPAQDAFLQDRINISHAILIARLQPDDQAKAFNFVFEDNYDGEKDRPCSVRELAGWIESDIHLDLKKAPFKLADDQLLPEAGSCVNCSKRTGFVPQLFPDIAAKDTCTDKACYQKKLQAHIDLQLQKAQTKKQELLQVSTNHKSDNKSVLGASKYVRILPVEEKCESSQKAIVVEGYADRGKTIHVCADPNCPVHGKGSPAAGAREDDFMKQERIRKEKHEKEKRIRLQIYGGISDGIEGMESFAPQDLRLIAGALLRLTPNELLKIVSPTSWDKPVREIIEQHIDHLSVRELESLILRLCIVQDVQMPGYWGDLKRPEILTAAAERFGVDVKAIEKSVAEKMKGKKKAKDARPGSVKSTRSRKKNPVPEEPSPRPEGESHEEENLD